MKKLSKVNIFYRQENPRAVAWAKKIQPWINKNYPKVKIGKQGSSNLIVLGGDGTILEAVRTFKKISPLILGLNLGEVGFLASAREPEDFLPALRKFVTGDYDVAKRAMVNASVVRNGKEVFKADALNEMSIIQSMLGMAKIKVNIDNHPLQFIRGAGIMVATATGSTGYNLSAHGPIVMPEMECLILTEILDHNIPTPSIVVSKDKKIMLTVIDSRKGGRLSISKTNEAADLLLIADGGIVCPLQKKDKIILKRSSYSIKFAELERDYFFKSLEEKFGFR